MQRMQSRNLFLPKTMTEQCSVSDSISRLNSSLSFDSITLRGNAKRAVLPPIREGQTQASSVDFDVPTEESVSENDGAGLARRFSLPSITSFDYPSSSSRKFSLPEAPVPQQTNLHACSFPGCNWSFKRGEHLKRHMAVHTRERPFPCSFPGCQRSFSRIDNLNVHFSHSL
ncbi:hypothetical protein DSO57_1001164 [Entomophthora muscae]|uniref:Uncharacterized protein n=1 Tax=Entomophthora muscae TaxID=34485 RepID=A0ACC2TWD8_9FUNG|nr:hypothetical protein DSO57_1001164 [Entomophthora muscae]